MTRGRAPGELILDKLSGQEAFEKISLPPLAAAVAATLHSPPLHRLHTASGSASTTTTVTSIAFSATFTASIAFTFTLASASAAMAFTIFA